MLRFGTDGVRGRAYADLFPDDVLRLAQVAAEVLAPAQPVVVGRDTRDSGPEFAAALAAGFSSLGVATIDMGVAPTAAVAWAAARLGTPGVMISASHNPWQDNGIKLFSPEGRKLDDDHQAALEARLAQPDRRTVPALGAPPRTSDGSPLVHDYQQAVTGTVDFDGGGLRVVVDAAHGSATAVLPGPLQAHNLDVTVINSSPSGRNINRRCGSTHPEAVAEAVLEQGAEVGLTFDGDADRVLAVDHTGELIDGDQIIAICATDRHGRGQLPDDTVVVTVMTNLGFHRAMAARGINVATTPVGDRHVWSALQDGGWALGGEQSGHVIFPALSSTGDGLVTALQLLDVVARRRLPLRDLAAEAMTKMPQVLHNVALDASSTDTSGTAGSGTGDIDEARLSAAVAEAEAALGDNGRVLVRPSGTEPVLRIMVEAETAEAAEAVAQDLVAACRPTQSAPI